MVHTDVKIRLLDPIRNEATSSASNNYNGEAQDNSVGIIVVTRFSIRKNGVLPTRDWIDHRFQLLTETTLPSLAAQTVQGFVWVILTAPEWFDYVSSIFKDVSLPGSAVKVIARPITNEDRESIHPELTAFITLRLDSDDILHTKTLERILHANDPTYDEILFNFPAGIQLDWDSQAMAFRTFRRHYQGPFLAVKHIARDAMFDLGGKHLEARDRYPNVITISGLNWVQVVHGGNIRNQMRHGYTLLKLFKSIVRHTPWSKRIADRVSPVPGHIQDHLLVDFSIKNYVNNRAAK